MQEEAHLWPWACPLWGRALRYISSPRLIEIVRHGRIDLTPLLTHSFPLDEIAEGYRLFGDRADGMMKVAIRP